MNDSVSPFQKLTSFLEGDLLLLEKVIKEYVKSEVSLVEQVAFHILNLQGKKIRPLLTLSSYYCALTLLNLQSDASPPSVASLTDSIGSEVHKLAAAVELIHNATLLHDDVIDTSDLRRGKPAAHTLFGNTASILVGDYLFAKAFQLMVCCPTQGVLDVLSSVSAKITEGEVSQLSSSFDINLDTENYISIIMNKTAILFEAATQVGAMVALQGALPTMAQEFARYGRFIGLAFQILDDLYDYFPPLDFGKEAGNDFLESKVTLPIIFLKKALKGTAEEEWLCLQFQREKKDRNREFLDGLEKIQTLCIQYNILTQCQEFASTFIQLSLYILEDLPSSVMRDIMKEVIQSLLTRPLAHQASTL